MTFGGTAFGWTRATILGIAFLLVTLGSPAQSSAYDESGSKRVVDVALSDWTAADQMEIRNLAGRMEVQGGNELKISVTFHAEPSAGLTTKEILGMVDIRTERKGNRVVISTDLPLDTHRTYCIPSDGEAESGEGSLLGSIFGSLTGGTGESNVKYGGVKVRVVRSPRSDALHLWANYKITVPDGVHLGLYQSVGPLAAEGVTGDLLMDTASGDVTARNMAGSLTVDTASGDLRLTDFHGDQLKVDTASGDMIGERILARYLHADTASGDLRLIDTSAGEFLLDTASGDIHLDTDLADCERMRIDTASGDVALTLPAEASFHMELDTASGDVTANINDVKITREDGEITGLERADGRTKVLVDTASGDVQVVSR